MEDKVTLPEECPQPALIKFYATEGVDIVYIKKYVCDAVGCVLTQICKFYALPSQYAPQAEMPSAPD